MSWARQDPLALVSTAVERLDVDLRSGKFDKISQHYIALEKALSTLQVTRLDAGSLSRLEGLKAKAGHHGRLIQAALRGMRDIQERHNTKSGFSSYTAQGSTDRIGRRDPRFEHRS